MIIPPRVQQYVVHGFCSSNCTDEVSVMHFILNGVTFIHIVSISLKMELQFLPTSYTFTPWVSVYLLVSYIKYVLSPTGVALTLKHIRNGTELKPIDINRNYDFNFQQTNYIPKVKVLPVCCC